MHCSLAPAEMLGLPYLPFFINYPSSLFIVFFYYTQQLTYPSRLPNISLLVTYNTHFVNPVIYNVAMPRVVQQPCTSPALLLLLSGRSCLVSHVWICIQLAPTSCSSGGEPSRPTRHGLLGNQCCQWEIILFNKLIITKNHTLTTLYSTAPDER
jgi:hypothetical protein